MAPVAIVFPRSAIPMFPSARFSAIIPEPTTVATKKNVPIASAARFLIILIYSLPQKYQPSKTKKHGNANKEWLGKYKDEKFFT